jgi:calcium-dependent protein kinase
MGSACSKRPVTASSKNQKKALTDFVKLGDFRKKYELINILGNGAFGKVRLYLDKQCRDMKYAIKTLKKENISQDLLNCITSEVKILSDLDHPNIVKYYETYEDDSFIHIVMEYLQGEDLYKLINKRKYSNFKEKDAAEIMTYLLKALGFIHKKGLVHRDIKPQNILFSIPGDYKTLKIIDFGLSTSETNKQKQRVGSPYYMAPEIINGKFSSKTDVWSVGVILFVMLTGVYPFEAKSQEEIFMKIQNDDYNKKVLDNKNCSSEVKDLLDHFLKKHEKERIDCLAALNHPWFKKLEIKTDAALNSQILENLKNFTTKNLLQKEILFYIAKISRDDELSKLSHVFGEIDQDNTGTLEKSEILEAFRRLDVKVDAVCFIFNLERA